MVAEGEKFAEEDELYRKRIETLNNLSSFVYGLKTQVADKEGLGGKLNTDEKNVIQDTVKESIEWLEENGQNASVEDLEEKLAGKPPMGLTPGCVLTLPFTCRYPKYCEPDHEQIIPTKFRRTRPGRRGGELG